MTIHSFNTPHAVAGSDYTAGVRGVGVVNALEVLAAYVDPAAARHDQATQARASPARPVQPRTLFFSLDM